MRTFLSMLLLLGMSMPMLRAQGNLAWWVTARFAARDTAIEGIPVRNLDPSWVAVSPLRESELPPTAAQPGEGLKDHDAAFELDGDFNRDGKQDKALVGVYRTSTNATGGFLLLLTRTTTGRWVKAALFKNPGGRFSAIMQQEGQLVWMFCFECDGLCTVIPSRGSWKLDCSRSL